MANPSSPAASSTPTQRPVLLWGPESDESHVYDTVDRAADFLGVSAGEVVAAIQQGDLLKGWFVDWEATGSTERAE